MCCISNTNRLRCHSLSRSVSQCTPAMPVRCRLQSAQVSIFEACAETKGKIHLPTFLKLLHGDGSTGPTGSTGSTMFATVVNVCNSLLVSVFFLNHDHHYSSLLVLHFVCLPELCRTHVNHFSLDLSALFHPTKQTVFDSFVQPKMQ